MNKIILGTMPINEAKSLQDQLVEQKIDLFLDHNEKTCNRGCSVTVELSCFEKDIQNVMEVISKNYQQTLEGHDIDINLINQVFDPNKEQATCPACGTEFSTSSSECPECGLCF
jgi:molecular chaperone GrpE (heat shock protein)